MNDGESAYFEIYAYNYSETPIEIIVEVYAEFDLETELSNAQALILDQVTELTYNRKLEFFTYTPTESNVYTITSISESDPYVVVYDSYGNFLIFDNGHEDDYESLDVSLDLYL